MFATLFALDVPADYIGARVGGLLNPAGIQWILPSAQKFSIPTIKIIGTTGNCIEHLIRMNGGDPDTLVAAYCNNQATTHFAVQYEQQRLGFDTIRSQCIDWWHSEEGRTDFNRRVFEFALRRLPDLIAIIN